LPTQGTKKILKLAVVSWGLTSDQYEAVAEYDHRSNGIVKVYCL